MRSIEVAGEVICRIALSVEKGARRVGCPSRAARRQLKADYLGRRRTKLLIVKWSFRQVKVSSVVLDLIATM